MGLKVYKECCKNCLFSNDNIVGPVRRKEIVQTCEKKQTHFQCHKATLEGEDIICKSFYDKLGHLSQMIRIAERLGAVEWIDQPEHEKLPSYNDMQK